MQNCRKLFLHNRNTAGKSKKQISKLSKQTCFLISLFRIAYRCAKATRWGHRLPMKIGEPFESENTANEIEDREDSLKVL